MPMAHETKTRLAPSASASLGQVGRDLGMSDFNLE